MPISEYYKGEGSKVMSSMMDRYGAKKGKEVFYATANKRGMKPGSMGEHMTKMKMAGKFKKKKKVM